MKLQIEKQAKNQEMLSSLKIIKDNEECAKINKNIQ